MEARKLYVVGALCAALGCGPDLGTCKLGKIGDCPQGTVCYAAGSNAKGAEGQCVVGELDEEGRLKVTIKSWKLVRGDEEIVPLRLDAAEQALAGVLNEDNPDASWVGKRAVELHLAATGSADVEKSLEVTAAGTVHRCSPVPGKCRTANCEWLCNLPEGWAGKGPVVEVEIKLGEQGLKRKRLYRVSLEPRVRFEVLDAASILPGKEVVFCITREEAEVTPVHSWEIQSLKLTQETSRGVAQTLIGWKSEPSDVENQACWRSTFPLTAKLGAVDAQLKASIVMRDMAGDAIQTDHSVDFKWKRLLCSADAISEAEAEVPPLALTPSGLVFGLGNRLYAYDSNCETRSLPLHTGIIRGSMVVLGDTHRMALTTLGGGPSQREGTRMTVVNTEKTLKFEASAGVMECHLNSRDASNRRFFVDGLLFDKGLTLFQVGRGGNDAREWHLAAPANPPLDSDDDAYLASLTLDGRWPSTPSSRCHATYHMSDTRPPIFLTPVQPRAGVYSKEALVVSQFLHPLRGTPTLLYWEPYENTGRWNLGAPVKDSFTTDTVEEATGLAAAGSHAAAYVARVWLSGRGLQRWDILVNKPSEGVVSVLPPSVKTSPAVVDSLGHAYVVVDTTPHWPETTPHVYELRRIAPDDNHSAVRVSLPGGVAGPVGSPILGQPLGESPAEIYVVTTQGTVLAFSVTMELLWTLELGMPVSATAQPVLTGNVLWIVGTRGEVRALRVGSNGLNRQAPWPKAFRDNCNTSSRQSTPDSASPFALPNCFF